MELFFWLLVFLILTLVAGTVYKAVQSGPEDSPQEQTPPEEKKIEPDLIDLQLKSEIARMVCIGYTEHHANSWRIVASRYTGRRLVKMTELADKLDCLTNALKNLPKVLIADDHNKFDKIIEDMVICITRMDEDAESDFDEFWAALKETRKIEEELRTLQRYLQQITNFYLGNVQ